MKGIRSRGQIINTKWRKKKREKSKREREREGEKKNERKERGWNPETLECRQRERTQRHH